MRRNRKYNPTRVSLSSIPDEAVREQLRNKFTELQITKELAVEAYRKSARTRLEAEITRAKAEMALLEMLEQAGEHIEQVKREPVWFIYSKDGDLVFENPFNEKDVRNFIRMEGQQRKKQIEQLSEEGNDDLYEDSSEE